MPAVAIVESVWTVPSYAKSRTGGFDLYWSASFTGFVPTYMPQLAKTESGPWVNLVGSPVSTQFALQVGPRNLSFQEQLYFRVCVLNGATVVTTSETAVPDFILNRHDFLLHREMLRRHDLGLRKYQGAEGYLLRRITNGPKCTHCLDEYLGSSADSQCAYCFGTSFNGGYYPAVLMWADWEGGEAPPLNARQQSDGPSEAYETKITIMSTYGAKTKDIWVEKTTGVRFEVTFSDPDLFRNRAITQTVTLSLLPQSDSAYSIPIT